MKLAQKNKNGSSNGSCLNDKAKFLYEDIIFKNIQNVKKKSTKKDLSKVFDKKIVGNKEIIFNGKNINKHFNGKNNKDVRTRKKLANTVVGNLDKLYFINDEIGYLRFNNLIIKISLGKQSNGTFFVKSYYIDNKLTKQYKIFSENNISIGVYTTRIDTVFGMTYAVLAPDHKDVQKFLTPEYRDICDSYIQKASQQSDQDRTADNKEKTGVFTGSYVINPFNGREVPLWIGDYVLGNYGTGAVMAVPAHDERDFEFAKKYDLEIIESISGGDISERAFTKLGILVNSERFDGLKSKEAQIKLTEFAEKNNFGSKKINYKLRDWLFSRQRYWGDPIPLIHLENEMVEKLDTKKMKVAIPQGGVTHNGDSAKLSSIRIILEYSKKVKRNYKKIQFDDLYLEKETEKGTLIFNGEKLRKHFYNKKPKELRFRKNHGLTIINELQSIIYESELVGYLVISGKIFRIVLDKIGNKKYEVKTYYSTLKYTKIFNEAYIKEQEDGDYLYIKGKEFSKIRDGIYGKIVGDNNLPVKLPEVEKFEPSGDGQSPLANVDSFVNVQLADNLVGKRETNTMPQWGGSCWYYLRYMNPDNKDMLVDPEVEKYWGQVDSYVGGAEHAVLHLLYARFWHKFLFDIGVVSNDEPFYRLRNQGLITAHSYENNKGKLIANDLVEEKEGKFFEIESGEELKQVIAKMSKSLKNVVNPDEIVEEYGADTLRLYEMYMADFKDSAPWDTKNIIGVKRFLDKVERAFNSSEGKIAENDDEAIKILNKTIRKVELDIENYKFNTAIASMMILVNYGRPTEQKLFLEWKEKFVVILSAFAPFLAEELYSDMGKNKSVFFAKWPEFDESLLVENTVKIAVQVLGKVRGTIKINKDESKDSVLEKARNNPDVSKWLEGKNLVKEIYVPGKIMNLVVK
ncbi:MAG: class I tRNA ligase family protein [Candidatus Gracilibacteria bacterium]|nr:class I tRNA ligase family protein [Candidatus Gracilibacteria bacterium]